MKFILFLFVSSPFINAILAFLVGEKYEQSFEITFMFVMAVCTLAVCNSIENRNKFVKKQNID